MSENTSGVYDAASAIDKLLDGDDSQLLLAISRYKSSVLELFGRNGLVSILCDAVDAAPNVDYYSRRSRREINPLRPEVNLRADHVAAMTNDPELHSRWRFKVANGLSEVELLSMKSDVIHTQVCREITNVMNLALQPHWTKAKAHAKEKYAELDERLLQLMLCTIFSIRIENAEGNNTIDPKDRMCTLLFFI